MMPGPELPTIGARDPPIPHRRNFHAATAGAGRTHNPMAVSGVTLSREARGRAVVARAVAVRCCNDNRAAGLACYRAG